MIQKIKQILASSILTICMLLSFAVNDTIISSAANPTYTLADESFVPTRSFYPYFLSVNSSCTSSLVKGIWARLLYEENNFSSHDNKGSFTSWSNEYYASDANYVGIGGTSVNWKGKVFSTDTGDFDAFLGNSLEANPEMFGQFLGLSGYGNSDYAKGYDTYRKVFQNKLSNPSTYKNFSKSIVTLTKDGKYLDNSSKSVSYNGETFSYWILCTLAYYYEGDGSETYLSTTQVNWLENQAPDLVNRYVSSGATAFNGSSWVASGNSLAGKYQPVYNLCARSTAGVNNGSKNIEFFNYVVASGHGAGAFLNKHNSINIPGLNNVDDLAALFNLSDGWCGTLDASASGCSSHTGACNAITKASCRPTNQGGKATDKDIMCVQLHRNSVAENFIKSNASIKAAYGDDASKSETWQYRHRVKHMGLTGNQAPSSTIPVDAIRAVSGSMEGGSNYYSPTYAQNIRKSGTMTKDIGHHTQCGIDDDGVKAMRSVAVIDLNTIFQNTNSPQKVAITFWGSDDMNYEQDDWAGSEGQYTTWTASSEKIQLIEGNLGNGYETYYYIGDEDARDYFYDRERDTQWFHYKSYVFDLSALTADELKTGWIQVSQQSLIHSTSGDEDGGVGPFHIATVWDKINNCDIYGHDYQTSADQVKWSSDYKTATITYFCNNNKKEASQPYRATSTAVKSADGKRITYTITGYKGETFTKVVSSSAGNAGVTYDTPLNGKVQGNNTDADSSDNVVYPAGSKSQEIYKLADSYINFTIPKGHIPAGTQKVQFSYYYSERLEELNIQIYNASNGKIMGQGGIGYTSTFNNPSTGLITIPLISNSNEELAEAYVVVTGKSQTQNWSSASSTPSTAHSSLGITKMKLYF